MNLITAIVRPEKLDELILALVDHGVRGVTVTDVRGFGQQYGRLAGAATRVTGRPGGSSSSRSRPAAFVTTRETPLPGTCLKRSLHM